MVTDAKRLLRDEEISAERSTAFVRCGIGIAVAIFFFVVVSPTLPPDNPALQLTPYFAAFCIGYFAVGIVAFHFARPGRFRGWMTWLFTTLDLCFWIGLLIATVLTIALPGAHIVALPPILIVFAILGLVALRNDPWLEAYALAFIVAAIVVLFLLAAEPAELSTAESDAGPIGGAADALGLFQPPLNVVRLAMIVLSGLILIHLAIRTRRLLRRAIDETVRRTNLARYLPPQLAGRLAGAGEDRLLAGASLDAAVLFVDIRGFATLAEAMPPEALGRFLADYRRIVSAEVHAHDGVVDKFVGDSVMAVFGAPDPAGNDAANALACAAGIVAGVAGWNAARREAAGGAAPDAAPDDVQVGVGVHWGQVFCGAVGDETRLEFTVLGDTVNVAARLEQLSKTVGRPIVVSEALLARAGRRPDADDGWIAVGDTPIRGRSGRVRVFARS